MPQHGHRPTPRTLLGMRLSTWGVLVPVVTIVAGALFATSRTAASQGSVRNDTVSIADLVKRGTTNNARVAARIDALQDEIEQLTQEGAQSNTVVAELTSRADGIAGAAGRTPVKGPAIEVTLNDSNLKSHELPSGFSVDDVVVHQQDVQAVVNALWAAGAEAMMLMDQRVISTSAVRCVGNTLILQGRVYSPPYVITAIGDVPAMQKGLSNDKQVRIYREYVAAVGLGYQVRTHSSVQLPAYSGTITPRYAVAGPPA